MWPKSKAEQWPEMNFEKVRLEADIQNCLRLFFTFNDGLCDCLVHTSMLYDL